jgi:chorismate synthase
MSFRKIRLLTAGESHGPDVSAILEGIPAGLLLSVEDIRRDMKRRQLGYGRGGRMKIEIDDVEFTAGIRHATTLGSPIGFLIRNRDFANWQDVMGIWEAAEQKRAVHRPRPGHADLAGGLKYSHKDLRNVLERASARETVARVAAGSICRQLLKVFGIEVASHVITIGHITLESRDVGWDEIQRVQDSDLLRCVDSEVEKRMIGEVDEAKKKKDTLGGIFQVVARNVPPGLGSHVQWDQKIDGRIAQAILSVPAVKGVAVGDAFLQAHSWGSEAHDEIFFSHDRGFYHKTNRAGGTEGGITNGEEIRVLGAMKPLSTLMKPLKSVDIWTKQSEDAVVERSDVCSVPAAGVVAEAMMALVLTDALLEKFSSDSMTELTAAVEHYREMLREF